MTNKEIKRAAKGCGFKKLRLEALELADMFRDFRKGRAGDDIAQRFSDMRVTVENMSIGLTKAEGRINEHVAELKVPSELTTFPNTPSKAKKK